MSIPLKIDFESILLQMYFLLDNLSNNVLQICAIH